MNAWIKQIIAGAALIALVAMAWDQERKGGEGGEGRGGCGPGGDDEVPRK